jgi:hypothetical protein
MPLKHFIENKRRRDGRAYWLPEGVGLSFTRNHRIRIAVAASPPEWAILAPALETDMEGVEEVLPSQESPVRLASDPFDRQFLNESPL